jgi:Ca2+-binding RTX toxin-like protein
MPLTFDQLRERLNGASSVTVGNIAYLNQWVYGRSHDVAAVQAVQNARVYPEIAGQFLPQGWTAIDAEVNPITGYKAIALRHDASNIIVIAQAGTGGPELADWGQNAQLRTGINAVDLLMGGPGRALLQGATNGTQIDDGIAFLQRVLASQPQTGMPDIIVSGHSLGGGVTEGVVAWARASSINNVTGVGFMSAPFPRAVLAELAQRNLTLPADFSQHMTHYVAESDIVYNLVGHDFLGRTVKHGGVFELGTRHIPVVVGPGGELFRTERGYRPSMLATHGSFAELVNATGSSTNSFVRTPLGNLVPIPGGLYPPETELDQRRFEQMRGWFAMQDVLENVLGTGVGWGEIDTSGTLRYSKDGGAVQTVTNYVNGGLGTPFRVESTSSKTTVSGGVANVAGTVEEVVVTGVRTGGVIQWALKIAGDTLAFLGGPAELGAIMNGVMRENMTSGAMYYPSGYDPDDPRRYFMDPSEPRIVPWSGSVEFTPREAEDMPFLGRAVLYNLDVVGATLGSYLGDGDRARGIAYSSLLGEIGGRLSDAIKAGQPLDLRVATAGGLDALGAGVATRAAQAGVGAVSSWLTMELGEALGIDGFGAELFNAAVGGVTNKILLNLADGAFETLGIFKDLNPGGLAAGGAAGVFGRSIGAFLGAKLGSMVVSPNNQAAVVLSSIGSAVGVATLSGAAGGGAAAALSGAISSTLGISPWIAGNIIAPGIGAFVGFVLGALAGNLFGSRKPKTPIGSAETALQIPYARYEVGPATIANKGNAWLVDTMATSARDALNSLISIVTFDNPDAFVANLNGQQTDQRYGHSGSNIYVKINGVQHNNFESADRAVDFGALTAIRNTMVVGGDLFSKRALAHSPAEDLLSLAGDLQVAADYRFYRNNKDLVQQIIVEAHGLLTASEEEYYKQNKAWIDIAQVQGASALSAEDRAKYDANVQTVHRIMAANDAQAVANPWIITLQRAAELNLDKAHASDFNGGLRGYVDSFATRPERLAYEDFSVATGILANPGPRPGSDMNGQGAFVVFAGQSNMGGYGVKAGDVNKAWRPDPLTKIWDPAAGAWVQMNPGVNTGYSTGDLQSAWGPEVNFAINFRATYPNEPLYIVKSVHGGTSIAADWTPARSDGLFASTSSLINAASAALGGRRPEHLMWGQGEGDAEKEEWANAYQQNLTAFLGAVRSQWLSDAGAEVALFRINIAPAHDGPVRDAQLAVDQAQANTLSFDANGFARAWPDELHFSNEGLDSIGRGFFDAFKTWHGSGTTAPPTGSPSTPPPSAGTGVVVTSDQHADTLTGTAGNDTLNSGVTSDTMTGGAGSDHFVFNTVPWSPATITDFAVTADKIDVRGLLPSTVTDPLAQGYVALYADGSGGTKVVLDPTGPGDGAFFDKFITVLSGVAHTAVTANNFIVGGPGTTPPYASGSSFNGTEGNDTFTGGTGADTIRGNGGDDVLTGSDGADSILGGEGADTIRTSRDVTGVVGEVGEYAHGNLGADTVTGGYGADTLIGGQGDDSLSGGEGHDYLSGDLGANRMSGGGGNDTLNAGITSDTLTGGAGADHFVFKSVPWSPASITDFSVGSDKIDLRALLPANYGGDPIADGYVAVFTDDAGGAKIVVDPTGPGDGAYFDKFITFLAGVPHTAISGNDFLIGPGPTSPPGTGVVVTSDQHADTLTGTAGNDTLNSGVTADTMTGGAGSDHFVFNTVPWSPATITDFAVTADKIDVRGLLPSTVTDPLAQGYVALYADGSGGTKVVLDPTGPGDGAFFDKFITVLSGVAHTAVTANNFIVGGSVPPPPGGTGVVVTSDQHADTLTGTSGNDTLNSGVTADTMSGGAGSDHFVFNTVPWSPATITDFEAGLDKIDLRGLLPANYNGDLIADGYVALFADEAGGTKVVMDPTGAADGAFFDKFITRVSGVAHTSLSRNDFLVGAGTTTPPPTGGGGGGVVITSGQHADTLVGTAGADTLISGVTSDTLTGGEGADHFVFNTVPWSPATITDFRVGVDKIDLRGLLPTNYTGNPIADGYIALYADEAGGTKVVIDPTGAADGAYYDKFVTYVRGVAHTSLTQNDFLVGAGTTTPPPTGGTGVVVTSDQHADTLTGTSGNDTLNSGVTADTMTGGAGSDHFVFNTVPWSPATITDFEVGLDKIDLRGLLPANYDGDLIADGYVALFADEAGGTKVVMDPTGAADGAFFDKFITRVSGVAHTSLSQNDFLVGSGTTTPPPTGGGGDGPPLLPVADAITIVRSGAAAEGFFSTMPGSNAAGDAISLEQFLGGASGYTAAGPTGMGGDNYRNESAATAGKIILDLGDDGSTGGDDIFIGSDHADRLEGRTGWDWLDGRAGNDTLAGGQHQDVLIGGQGADQLEGALGDDYLAGGDDHDKLYGGDGADVMAGGADSDELRGDGGDDILLADDDAAADTLDGGDGADAVSYERFGAAVIADLRQGGLHGDVWTSIEGLIGGAASDQLVGNSTANRLQGGSGADTLSGLEGDDVLEGGAGADRVEGGEGRDTASYEDSQIGVDVDLDLVRGAGGEAEGDSYFSVEDVRGSRFFDRLRGSEGDNRLFGMAGNDWIMASAGADLYDGGAGNDIIDYTLAAGAVQAYLGSGLATQPVSGSGAFTGAEHQLEGFETAIGSAFADTLSAGLGNQTFVGGRGHDSLSGGVHSDTYVWTRGDGVDNIAELEDGWNELKLTGDIGFSDLILGTAGEDQGFLEVHVRDDTGYLRVNGNWRNADVPLIKALTVGESRLELSSGLNAPLASASGDTMRGKDTYGDLLFGFDGNDVMQTREHPYNVDFIDHVLVGGRGDDLMTSSAGNDQYAFDRGDGFDVILFDHGGEDTLVFGPSVAANDIIFKVDGDDLYVGVRDLNNPQLDAMQVATRVHIVGGAIKYISQQSGLEYHVIERIEAGGASMDLRKMDIPWSRTQTTQYDYVRPIVFDLDGDGLDLTTVDSSTVVAKTEAGILSRVAWVGPTEGLLAFDRNGDGDINQLSEISFVQDLDGATTDLEGLRGWDTNKDGRLDAGDEGWGKLQIWTDRNQNGRSTKGELRTLEKAGIEAIHLTGEATGYDPSLTMESYISNTIRYETKKGSGTAYDVSLARRLINSEGYYAGEHREEWGQLNEDGELGLLLNDPKEDAAKVGKKPVDPTKKGLAGRVLEYGDVAAAAKVDFSDSDSVDRKVAERWDYRLDPAKAAAWKEREAKSEYDRGKIDVAVGRNKANPKTAVGSAASITAPPEETFVVPPPATLEAAQDLGPSGTSHFPSEAKSVDAEPTFSAGAEAPGGSARPRMLGRGSADSSDWWRGPTSLGEFLETGAQLGRTGVRDNELPSSVSAGDNDAGAISLVTQQLLLQQAVAGFSDGGGFASPVWRVEEQQRHHELAAGANRSIAA